MFQSFIKKEHLIDVGFNDINPKFHRMLNVKVICGDINLPYINPEHAKIFVDKRLSDAELIEHIREWNKGWSFIQEGLRTNEFNIDELEKRIDEEAKCEPDEFIDNYFKTNEIGDEMKRL